MKSEINLESRDGSYNRLVQIESNPLKYKLKTDYCYRVGIIEDNSEQCSFIDPSGGPFICIGCEIDGHKVKSIYKDGIIEFES